MRRREFITLVGGAVAWPVTARAEQSPMPAVGFLNSLGSNDRPNLRDAFDRGLHEAGFVRGSNIAMEYRYADNQVHRLPALAADLVTRRVAVIAATGGGASVQAAKKATTTIPIVFVGAGDPVIEGYVASLNRPGGNLNYGRHLVRYRAQRQGSWVAARACSQRDPYCSVGQPEYA
jgi:putative tryptophan/tyrosine transport system substrate-binding protein